MNVLDSDDASIDDLARIIGHDQALSAEVLRLANSGKLRPVHRTAELPHAITRVGFSMLWEILIQASTQSKLDRGLPAYGLSKEAAWRHAATAAEAARLLATKLKLGSAKEASIAGLLHDIGKVALSAVEPETVARAVALANVEKISLSAAETRELGFDHGQVGGALLRRWALPDAVADAVTTHHAPNSPMAVVVHLADFLAHRADILSQISKPDPKS